MSQIFRSLLFVPGNKANMLEKALGVAPDVLVPDMEDSVPDAEKANARETIAAHLPRLAAGGRPIVPRVNALDTPWTREDLAAVVGPHIFGVCIGKIHTAAQILEVAALLEPLERTSGLAPGSVKLIPWIESARGIMNCYEICIASPRLVAIAFGAEDFTHDMGIERLDEESQLAYPRATVCIAARAAGLQALDTPYFQFKDEAGLRANARAARQAGFKGKFAIHPAQIGAINESFSPSREEIERAQRVVAAFEEAERQGRGSTSLDGRVIDVPVVKRARALLSLAQQAHVKTRNPEEYS
jgi:citrate lyase subunit beta / citryl-CoA lyase